MKNRLITVTILQDSGGKEFAVVLVPVSRVLTQDALDETSYQLSDFRVRVVLATAWKQGQGVSPFAFFGRESLVAIARSKIDEQTVWRDEELPPFREPPSHL